MSPAPIADVRTTPESKACVAEVSRASATGAGSVPATSTAPPRVSPAVVAAAPVTESGTSTPER